MQTVYVEFSNTGTCFSSVGRTYWPFPVAQERYHERVRERERERQRIAKTSVQNEIIVLLDLSVAM